MSMYGIISGGGDKPTAELVLEAINSVAPISIPRYRDAYIEKNDDAIELVIFTRTGGGNRECYCEEAGCNHESCCYHGDNDKMAQHPLYLRDDDDNFDSTYAKFYFNVPDAYKERIETTFNQEQGGKNPASLQEKTNTMVEKIQGMSPEEIRKKFPEITGIFDKIAEDVNK
jgi:hypothetical protein